MSTSTTTDINCQAFVFNFYGATVNGNVIINIPNVGEVFCGEAGTTSGGSTYTNKTTTSGGGGTGGGGTSTSCTGWGGIGAGCGSSTQPIKVDVTPNGDGTYTAVVTDSVE